MKASFADMEAQSESLAAEARELLRAVPQTRSKAVSGIVLAAVAIEIGMKALYLRQTGLWPANSHKTTELLSQINSAARRAFDREFSIFNAVTARYVMLSKPGVDLDEVRPLTMEENFETLDTAFVTWRYGHEYRLLRASPDYFLKALDAIEVALATKPE